MSHNPCVLLKHGKNALVIVYMIILTSPFAFMFIINEWGDDKELFLNEFCVLTAFSFKLLLLSLGLKTKYN